MITYLKGDATRPVGDGPKMIIHICNDVGGWGAGFVLAISKRWPKPEADYRTWARQRKHPSVYGTSGQDFVLGQVQVVPVEPHLWVANMVAQTGYGRGGKAQHKTDQEDDLPPIRYDALALCLRAVRDLTLGKASVHCPRIGCGLAGGKWERVEPLIAKMLDGVPVYVYDLAGR
jgi:O-acetyl-ADP-ribose deacetylase (regulator of RNase III)